MKKCDLTNLDVVKSANEGVEFELLHPATGEALGVFISVLGKDSDVFRSKIEERANRALRKGKKKFISIAAAENDSLEILSACTTGWRNVVDQGKEIKFSQSAAKKLYAKYPWMKDQVDEAIGDRSLFLGN